MLPLILDVLGVGSLVYDLYKTFKTSKVVKGFVKEADDIIDLVKGKDGVFKPPIRSGSLKKLPVPIKKKKEPFPTKKNGSRGDVGGVFGSVGRFAYDFSLSHFVDDYVFNKIKSVENSDGYVPDVHLKSVNLDFNYEGDTLLDVLKNNNQSLLQVLGVISQNLSSIAVTQSIVVPQLVQELQKIREVLVTISPAILSLRNSDLVSVLENHLSKISEAKELEKEHYEFMKTPRPYNIEDVANSVPDISPREAMALSSLINSHLLSQEATLSAEDLELDDYDIDFNEVIAKLFNFEGISKDIEKFKGGNNGS